VSTELTVLGFAGSLRRDSWNRALLRALTELAPELMTVVSHPLADLPMYNADDDVDGGPPPVRTVREAAAAADALLFVTPEYNWGVPAVTKNLIDWLSRPFGQGPIWNKPMAMACAGPGRGGGEHVLAHLGESLGVLSPALYPEPLAVAGVNEVLTLDGEILDRELAARVVSWLVDIGDHVRAGASRAAG